MQYDFDYSLKKRNITDFEKTRLDISQRRTEYINPRKYIRKDYEIKNEKKIDQILFPIFENEKKEDFKFYEEFEKKEIIIECPDYVINNKEEITFPEEIKNFMKNCRKNNDDYFLDILPKLNLFFIFSKNKIYFFNYNSENSKKNVFYKELDFKISYISLVQKNKDNNIFMIYSKNCEIYFYGINSRNELLNLNLKKKQLFIKQTFFSNFTNSLLILDKNDNIFQLEIDMNNEKYFVKMIKNNNIFGLKKIKEITSKKFDDFKNYFSRKKIKYDSEFIFKDFSDFLIILKNKIKIVKNKKIIEDQILLIFQYKNEKDINFIKEINLNIILGINIVIFQNLKNFQKLFQKKILIIDFDLNQKNELFLLLENKIELKINIHNLNLKKLKTFKFLNKSLNNLKIEKYIDNNKILGFLDNKAFLIIKSNLNCYAFDEFGNIDSWSILDLGEFDLEYFNFLRIKKNNFLKNEKEKFLVLKKNGISFFEKLNKIDFLANLIILEVFYSKFLKESFFCDFFEKKKKIGLKNILEVLAKILLVNKQNYFCVINEFLSLLLSKYQIEVKKFLHENENFDFLNFQMVVCKYFTIFSGEINDKRKKKIEDLEKKKKSENYNERIILNIILNSINSFENDFILQDSKKKIFINRKIDLKLFNLKEEITSLLKSIFFFENVLKKNKDFSNLTNDFINYIKSIKFQNCSQIIILEKEIFSQNIINFVLRIKNVISFLLFFKEILKNCKIDLKIFFMNLNLKDLFFYTNNDNLIKNIIIFNFEFINDEHNFVNTFLNRNYIEALIEFEKFKTEKNFISNFEKEKFFINKMKCLDFCYLKDFVVFFWKKNLFNLFLKIILEKLKNKKEFLKENEVMKVFIFATLINLLTEKHNSEKTSLKNFFLDIYKKTKNHIIEKTSHSKNFNLSKSLKNLNNEKRLLIIKNLIQELLKHPNDDLRKNTIFLLLQNNESEYIKKTDYENKINDIIKISTNSKMFENKLGFKNGYFMIKFLIRNNKFLSAFEIILKILQNKKIEVFLEIFDNKKNFFYFLNENFEENIKKWKEIEYLGLEELKTIVDQGNNLKKNIDLSKKENNNKFEILKHIEINLKLNILIKKDLSMKKKYFERLLNLDKNLINKEIIEKIIKLINFEIFFINLNPKFEKNNILEKIIKKNKLYLTMYKLPKFIGNAEYSFSYKIKILKNILILYGKLNNEESISKISNHFETPEIYKNFKLLNISNSEKKNLFIKDLQKNNLIYPYNLPDKIHFLLADFFDNKKCQIIDIKNMVKIIEKFNMNNKFFKILVEEIFSFERNCLNSKSLWHFFYIYKKFEDLEIKKKENNLCMIYKFLSAYFLLCEEIVKNEFEEKCENLKFKFFHSFLILFEFLMVNIKKFLEKKEPFENEKMVLFEFCRNFDYLINCLDILKNLSFNVVSQNTFFCAYFKFKEKILFFEKKAKSFYHSKNMNPYRNGIKKI